MKHPIFIVGCPRSGTNMLAETLGNHPELCNGPATHLFSRIEATWWDILARGELNDALVSRKIASLNPAGAALLKQFGTNKEDFRNKLEATVTLDAAAILKALYSERLKNSKASRIVETTPDHLLHVELIRRHFPESTIIRMIRDPRDSAISMKSIQPMFSGFGTGAILWERWHNRSHGFFGKDKRSITLRYEDLHENPEATLQSLCEACQLDFVPSILPAKNPGKENRPHRWMEQAGDPEIRAIESICRNGIREFGYEETFQDDSRHTLSALAEFPMLHASQLLDNLAKKNGERCFSAFAGYGAGAKRMIKFNLLKTLSYLRLQQIALRRS